MSQTVTGIQAPAPIGRYDGHTNFASQDFVVASGVTLNPGDFVYFNSTNGNITNATIEGARILGMVTGGSVNPIVGTATGTVTATVVTDPDMRYLLQGDAVFASVSNGASTSVGQYYDLNGAGGAQLVDVDTAGTTIGQVLCVGVPGVTGFPSLGLQGLTANKYGIFVIVNHAYRPYVAG